jgi:predicted DsbA family dithiol-disulfide isomerase
LTQANPTQWCYLGHRRLQKAISAYQAAHASAATTGGGSTDTDTFTITWHAYYLNPEAPPYPGIEKKAYLERQFQVGLLQAMQARLAEAGAADGVKFQFGGKTGRSRDSHRLVYLAGQKLGSEAQTRVVEALGRAYFLNEENITDKAVLVRAAVDADVGIDAVEAKKWLNGDEGGAEVDREALEETTKYINAVPHFTIQGKYVVEGAEQPQVFLEIFEKVKKEEK